MNEQETAKQRPTEKQKSLELERLVFFSDAVVAIAITLLALDLKIEREVEGHLTFADIGNSWITFVAFTLSFVIIAVFWKAHHQFFMHIRKVDERLLLYNLGWLLFIVTLPFSSTLVSAHFYDAPAVFIYSCNILAITVFQNLIWDYVASRKEFLKPEVTDDLNRHYRVACNIAMGNAVVAIGLAFVSPVIALIVLLTRTMLFRMSAIWHAQRAVMRKEGIEARKQRRDQFMKK